MGQKQQEIVRIYKKKFDMNLGSLAMFLNQKIEASSFQIDVIQNKIRDLEVSSNFDDEQLTTILRLIAAVQTRENVNQMTRQEIRAVKQSIKFKSSKNKSKKQKRSNFISQNSQTIQVQPQYVQIDVDNEKYPSVNYQIPRTEQKPQKYEKSAKESNPKIQQNISKFQKMQNVVEVDTKTKDYIDAKFMEQKKQKYFVPESAKLPVKEKEQQVQINKNTKERTTQKQSPVKQKRIQQKKPPIQNKSPPANQKKVSESKLRTIYQENTVQFSLPSQKQRDKGQPVYLSIDKQMNKKKVRIPSYEKYSIDYVKSVIKYKIEYRGISVQRRYSDFEKLMTSLNRKYEGIILPQLPPKQGIKGEISYFWGIDQNFLNQRQVKLQQLLNRLLESKFVQKDDLLQRFLSQEIFQVNENQEGFGSYLKTVTDIVFNAKQLKDYGMAYYTYLKQSGAVKLNNDLQKAYEDMQQTINIFVDLNSYRTIINGNFQKRRKIMFDQSVKCRSATNSQLDKMMDLAIQQIKNLHNEYNKYRYLKNQQSWISSLIRQKSEEATTKAFSDLKKEQNQLKERIQKMQKNLMESLKDFSHKKKSELQILGQKLIEWRKKVHP